MTKAEKTKRAILNAGLICWPDISARRVGAECGLTHTAVLHHFPGDGALKQAVAKHAVEVEDSRVVRLLICNEDALVAHMCALEKADYFFEI